MILESTPTTFRAANGAHRTDSRMSLEESARPTQYANLWVYYRNDSDALEAKGVFLDREDLEGLIATATHLLGQMPPASAPAVKHYRVTFHHTFTPDRNRRVEIALPADQEATYAAALAALDDRDDITITQIREVLPTRP